MTPNDLVGLGIPKVAHKEAYAVVRERRDDGVPMSMIEVLIRDIATNASKMVSGSYDVSTRNLASRLVSVRKDPE